jgi:hypothetical protein
MRYRLLTEVEVAKILAMPVESLRRMRSRPPVKGAPIPYTKIGHAVRYREDLLDKWIKDHTYDSTEDRNAG